MLVTVPISVPISESINASLVWLCIIVGIDYLTLPVFTGDRVEVYFHTVEAPDWYDGTVQRIRNRKAGKQIEVYFETDNTASWLTVKDEKIRYPVFHAKDEDEAGEGGGAMNESDDEVPEGESN